MHPVSQSRNTRNWPLVDEATRGSDLVLPVTYWDNEVVEVSDPESGTEILSLDEIREELKRKDAKAKDSSEYGRGMTVVLDDEGKKYIRFLTWGQVWTNLTENNPGTIDATGDFQDTSLGIGLRRVRFLTYSQLTEKYLILLHVGINNQTFSTGGDTGTREFGSDTRGFGPGGVGKKPQIFVHDFWNEYTIFPQSADRDFSLATGAGIHYWNGISRKSSSSTFSYMTVDSNIFCWPNIEFTDQFARQLGWYFKGKLHKLDYRFSVNHPFNTDDRDSLNTARAVNIGAHTLSLAGYFEWEFWDQESNVLPFKTSTWLGEKSVFNIGTGFYFQPDASGILDATGQTQEQDHVAVGIDWYFDKPVGDCGAALTVYNAYYILRLWRQLLPQHRDHEHGHFGTAGSAGRPRHRADDQWCGQRSAVHGHRRDPVLGGRLCASVVAVAGLARPRAAVRSFHA